MSTLPKLSWRKCKHPDLEDYWQYHIAGYAVLGTLHRATEATMQLQSGNSPRWVWEARPMEDCRVKMDGHNVRPVGAALSIDGAKTIIEAIIAGTKTYEAQLGEDR